MHMIKRLILMAGIAGLGALCLSARAAGTPHLQFDETVYDFGKTSQVTTVSGVFKFKNTGDGVLKMQKPQPSCGCTAAEVRPDTLAPGATGEIPFTLNLGFYPGHLEKHITARSNDPKNPEVSLTILVDYTPLYEMSPLTLAPTLAFGMDSTNLSTTLARTDGKPMHITRLETSQPWITATLDSGTNDVTSTRIHVGIQRNGSPRRFNEYVHVYTSEQSNAPSASLYIYGEISGEVSLSPEALYWSITDAAKTAAERPAALMTQKVAIRSADGQPLELKNLQSSIKGINVQLVPQGGGTVYELIARLDDVPASTISGKVSFDTSVPAQPRIELPVIVNVFKPQ
jgi:hypothetical protein